MRGIRASGRCACSWSVVSPTLPSVCSCSILRWIGDGIPAVQVRAVPLVGDRVDRVRVLCRLPVRHVEPELWARDAVHRLLLRGVQRLPPPPDPHDGARAIDAGVDQYLWRDCRGGAGGGRAVGPVVSSAGARTWPAPPNRYLRRGRRPRHGGHGVLRSSARRRGLRRHAADLRLDANVGLHTLGSVGGAWCLCLRCSGSSGIATCSSQPRSSARRRGSRCLRSSSSSAWISGGTLGVRGRRHRPARFQLPHLHRGDPSPRPLLPAADRGLLDGRDQHVWNHSTSLGSAVGRPRDCTTGDRYLRVGGGLPIHVLRAAATPPPTFACTIRPMSRSSWIRTFQECPSPRGSSATSSSRTKSNRFGSFVVWNNQRLPPDLDCAVAAADRLSTAARRDVLLVTTRAQQPPARFRHVGHFAGAIVPEETYEVYARSRPAAAGLTERGPGYIPARGGHLRQLVTTSR